MPLSYSCLVLRYQNQMTMIRWMCGFCVEKMKKIQSLEIENSWDWNLPT